MFEFIKSLLTSQQPPPHPTQAKNPLRNLATQLSASKAELNRLTLLLNDIDNGVDAAKCFYEDNLRFDRRLEDEIKCIEEKIHDDEDSEHFSDREEKDGEDGGNDIENTILITTTSTTTNNDQQEQLANLKRTLETLMLQTYKQEYTLIGLRRKREEINAAVLDLKRLTNIDIDVGVSSDKTGSSDGSDGSDSITKDCDDIDVDVI